MLLWVGCGGALVERNQKVVRALAQLLNKAGVKFAILGREEKCTGDPARRIGNEFLFEQLAQENIATLDRHQVKTIVTSCPHCFNTFRNEYPQFGGQLRSVPPQPVPGRLVDEGKLAGPHADGPESHVPRSVLPGPAQRRVRRAAATGADLHRPTRRWKCSRAARTAFAAAAAGGMSFVDEPPDKRVNQERARQVLATGADVVAVGCPFCMTMLEDGINATKGDRDVRVMDVAELLWQAGRASPRLDCTTISNHTEHNHPLSLKGTLWI